MATAPDAGRPAARGLGVALSAVAGSLLAAVPGLSGPGGFATATWLLVVLPVALVTTVALWVAVVPRGGGRAALGCAAAALVSLAAFRVGLTLPLAGAALVLARDTPVRDPQHERAGWWALALTGVAVLGLAYRVAVDALAWAP